VNRALTLLCVCFLAGMTRAEAQVGVLESGLAITDPDVLQALETERFSIGALLSPKRPPGSVAKNSELFKDAPLKNIVDALAKDIDTLPQASLDTDAKHVFKTPESRRLRFSSYLLNHPKSGFVLTGIVNRMDRAYRTMGGHKLISNCGEIRFLYRFTYDVQVNGGQEVASRLPFTASVVFNGKSLDDPISCADIAGRWQEAGRKSSAAEVLSYLKSDQGPLNYLKPSQLDRVEVNLQLFRLPVSDKPDFGGYAEYLLRVFKRDTPNASFVATPMENQIDRDKLLRDDKLRNSFKRWLFSNSAIWDLDHGLLDIPDQYLTTRAVSASPGGASRSQNEPLFGLATDDEIAKALKKYEASGEKLQTVKSVAGFYKRLNDVTCTGCHQIRAIAGFHFPGSDPGKEPPSNAVHVPGSAHFFGDLPRRRAIVAAFAGNKPPDFSRGFTDRPDGRFKSALADTQLFDGWGAACFIGKDASFAGWTCRAGLHCKVLHGSPRDPGMGTCVTADALRIGDPVEFGAVSEKAYGDDSYKRTEPSGPAAPDNYEVPPPPDDRSDYRVAHQGYRAKDSTGGFPAGMLRINGCDNLPHEATCGRVAATGFNDCISAGKPFPECLKLTQTAGLRACDRANPCRDDYICTAPYEDLSDQRKLGTCIPPYFMFQFRVDGHPSSFSLQ
jgi:hypothetical protein